MKTSIFLMILGFCANAYAANRQDYNVYFLATGKHLQCDRIYKNICIAGIPYENETELKKIMIFFDSINEDHQDIIKIQKIAADHYKITSGSFYYDFQKKSGYGSENEFSVKVDGSGKLSAIKEHEYLFDPS